MIAVVTARGGSKGIPKKNLRVVRDKTLVGHACYTGREVAGRVILSTDSEEIAEEGERWGADILWRPAELATDTANSRDVVAHAIQELELLPTEEVLYLSPTYAERTIEDCFAVRAYWHRHYSAPSAVCSIPVYHPCLTVTPTAKGKASPFCGVMQYRRQERREARGLSHYVVWLRAGAVEELDPGFYHPETVFYSLDRAPIDIDTITDLRLANE